ncbi:MAG TPA: hypothetical protein PLA50_07995 [Bacteroidia bacterium]|nr:hypothetical protein [Bacteroidia bacterium]
MKTPRPLLLSLLALLWCQGWAEAQIRDNESSIAALAIQCAISSGYSAEGFMDYSGGLAKTLSQLSGEQQARVFGFVPSATSGRPSYDPNSSSSPSPVVSPESTAPASSPPAQAPVNETPASNPPAPLNGDGSGPSNPGSNSAGSSGSSSSGSGSSGSSGTSQIPAIGEDPSGAGILPSPSLDSTLVLDPNDQNKKGSDLWDLILGLVQKVQEKL